MVTNWTRSRWSQVRAKKLFNVEDAKQIWLEPREFEMGPHQYEYYSGGPDAGFSETGNINNKDHPWAMEILKEMPNFSPVIMFQVCEEKCCLPIELYPDHHQNLGHAGGRP